MSRLMTEAKTLDEALDIAQLNLAESYPIVDNPILRSGQATINCIREWAERTGILHRRTTPPAQAPALIDQMDDVWVRSLREDGHEGGTGIVNEKMRRKAHGRMLAMLSAQMPKREDEAMQAIPIVVGALEDLLSIQHEVADSSGAIMTRLTTLGRKLGRHVIDEATAVKERRR